MSRIWDWLIGQTEKDAELARQRAQEAREADLKRLERDLAQKPPEPIRRVENEARPGERFMPHQIERQRRLHDHPPAERKLDLTPAVERVAIPMKNTPTPQPAPSLNGPGPIKWKNPWVMQPTVADKLLDAGRAHKEAQPQPDKQPQLGPDIDDVRVAGATPLFPDYSKGLQLKLSSGKRPGEEDQQ